MTFYNIGWIANKFDFKKDDWNEFGYYQCPDVVKISVKILNYDNIIVRKDYDGGKLFRTEFDKFDERNEDVSDILNKAN